MKTLLGVLALLVFALPQIARGEEKAEKKYLPLISSILINGDKFFFTSLVSKNPKTGEFIYVYNVFNASNKAVSIQWNALNITRQNNDSLVNLKPNESIEFTILHKNKPREIGSKVRIFNKDGLITGGPTGAYIPESLIKEK